MQAACNTRVLCRWPVARVVVQLMLMLMLFSGHGKTHRDAASVQATHAIPAACGLYYFEVKIVSKGRDGYMGIGLSAQGVNMNRLPGTYIPTYVCTTVYTHCHSLCHRMG